MQLHSFDEAGEFLSAARGQLLRQPVVNNLMLGVSLRLMRHPELLEARPYFAAVMQGEELAAAAMITPPFGLVLASPLPEPSDALAEIAADLEANGWNFPDVIGPKPLPRLFAELWQARRGGSYRLDMAQRVYALRQVQPPPPVAGDMRAARVEDENTITDWILAFDRDAFGQPQRTPEKARDMARARTLSGDIFLWEDGGVAAMAMRSRPAAGGITVNLVYTPPERRRQGYASALVAALSQKLLDAGYDYCTLFTDLANPTSNSIYSKIGYQPVADFDKYAFKEASS